MTTGPELLLGWLLTYAVHSTVLLGGAWWLARRLRTAIARDLLWKTALFGALVTATVQGGLGIRPAGSISLGGVAASSVARTSDAPARVARAKGVGIDPIVDQPATTADVATPAPAAAVPSTATILIAAWIVIGAALALVFVGRRLILVGRLGDRRAITDAPLAPLLAALAARSRVRDVRLTSSATISSPVALGRREICVPSAAITDLEEDQQRGLLAHELAHLERRDPLWLDVAGIVERVFFFQPLNRVARRELQVTAEFLCDESAAARLGSGVPLAKCLARVAEWIQASPLGVPVAGMAEQRSQLVERISRLVSSAPMARPLARPVMAVGALGLLAIVIAAAPGAHPPVVFPDRDTASPRATALVVRQDAVEPEQDPAVVAALMDRLADSDARVRRAAASALGNLRARRAVTALITALDDKDRDVVEAAAEALGNIRDPRAVNRLLDLLHDGSVKVRHAALSALEDFEREELPAGPFTALLRDGDADMRHRAASILGNIHDRASVGALGAAVHDPSPEVREAVVRALGEIQDESAATFIVPALHDAVADVRHVALEAMRELHGTVDRTTIVALLGDQATEVRGAAIDYVRERPFDGAVGLLLKLVDDPSAEVRVGAIEAIGEMRDPSAGSALKTALSARDPAVRAKAAEILGERRP